VQQRTSDGSGEANGQTSAEDAIDGIPLVRAFPIAANAIPVRPWLIPGLLIRNHVGVLVAPPGAGKSLFTLQLALCAAKAMPWAGWTPRQACRTLVINSEDDLDEMRRRLVASAEAMGVAQDDVRDLVFLAEHPESIVVARSDPATRTVVRTPLVEKIVTTILAETIDVVAVDPFAETFEGDENSNSELKWAAILWREVARRTGAAILLVHHTRKYANGMSGDADASRGAGALIGVARIVSTMFPMTDQEAEAYGVPVEERLRYVRHDDAKANLHLVTAAARWFFKESRPLGNGGLGLPGDEVGVLIPWSPPGVFEGASTHALNQILNLIDAGLLDEEGRPNGELYTAHKTKEGKRWAGQIIVDVLDCDEGRAKKILKAWLETGLLTEVEFRNANRKARKGLKVDNAKRPGRTL
jgi:hypothetical protein